MQLGKEMLGRRHVLDGVEYAIHDVQVEGTFPVSLLLTQLNPRYTDQFDHRRTGM